MITKKFSKSFDDALTQAYLFQTNFLANQADFIAFSSIFDDPFAADFLDLITAADDIPTFEDDQNESAIYTLQVEETMEKARNIYKKLVFAIDIAWPNSEVHQRVFRVNLYESSRQIPQKMINLLQNAHAKAILVAYNADLLANGFNALDIALLATVETELTQRYNAQQDFIQLTFERTENRTVAFNLFWDEMVKISNASKMIFKDSPARIEIFLLYPENAGPGSLTAPTDLSFYLPSTTFSWSEVPHATSFSFEISTDGISFTEQYSGSETSCSYVPEQEGWMWYRVRARNANGFGPYSTVLQQGYYPGTVLPAPENLVLQLAAGSPNTIELTWTPVPSATTYTVNRSIVAIGAGPGPFSFVTNTHDPEYVETVIPGNRFYFNLTASNSSQWSGVSVNVFIDVV